MIRRLTTLFSVLALANPLCCCWGEVDAGDLGEKTAVHACCESSNSTGESSPAEEGDASHTCPHESGALLAAEVQSWNLVVSIPNALDAPLYRASGFDPMESHLFGKIRMRYDGSTARHPPPFSAYCCFLI